MIEKKIIPVEVVPQMEYTTCRTTKDYLTEKGQDMNDTEKGSDMNDIDILLNEELKKPDFRKAWEETELEFEYRIKEQMIELIDLLGMVSDTYPDFVVGVTQYCIRKPSRLEMVLQFLKENSNADSSDISEFIVNQPDFLEDNTAPVI